MPKHLTTQDIKDIEQELGPNVICTSTGRVAKARGDNYTLEMVLLPTPCTEIDRERVISTVLQGGNGIW